MKVTNWFPHEDRSKRGSGWVYMVGNEWREPWRIRCLVEYDEVTVYAGWQGDWYETNAATIGPKKYAEIERLARLTDFTA